MFVLVEQRGPPPPPPQYNQMLTSEMTNDCDPPTLQSSAAPTTNRRMRFSGLMWCDVIVTIYKPRWETWHWIWGREGGRVTHNDDNDVFSHQEVAPGQGLNICQNNPRCLDQLGAPPLLRFSYPPATLLFWLVFTKFLSTYRATLPALDWLQSWLLSVVL